MYKNKYINFSKLKFINHACNIDHIFHKEIIKDRIEYDHQLRDLIRLGETIYWFAAKMINI